MNGYCYIDVYLCNSYSFVSVKVVADLEVGPLSRYFL